MDVRFAAAKRHSRFVRVLRVAVPALVVLSLAAIIAVSVFNPFRILANLPLNFGNMVVSGTKITMETPHLTGFSPEGRPYELWAKTATQDLTKPDSVELAVLRAKVEQQDKSIITLDARKGLFDTKTQLLDLKEDIFLKASTGYEAQLTRALVDIAAGSVTSDEPVAVKLLSGTLDGQRLKITEHGDLVRFEGGVKMNLTMEQPASDVNPELLPDPVADPVPAPVIAPKPKPAAAPRSVLPKPAPPRPAPAAAKPPAATAPNTVATAPKPARVVAPKPAASAGPMRLLPDQRANAR